MKNHDTQTVGESVYTTLEALLADAPLAPIQEDFQIPGTNKVFRIEGITLYTHRQNIRTKIQELTKLAKEKKFKVLFNNELFVPSEDDIAAAVWCAACVKNPALKIEDWLKYGYAPKSYLHLIELRALICSRLIDEIGQDGEVIQKNGIDKAREEFEADPLDLSGEGSAEKNSTDSPEK